MINPVGGIQKGAPRKMKRQVSYEEGAFLPSPECPGQACGRRECGVNRGSPAYHDR